MGGKTATGGNADGYLIFAGGHHARWIDERVPMHLISRVFQGRHLLRPDSDLNDIIIGVLGRARELFSQVRLYAVAFMSNHMHMLAQGPADQLPFFVGFVKREISRRWGGRPEINWPGVMWHEYIATALPTVESQLRCFKYILSQGVKENLVARPQDWPGVHSARAIMSGNRLRGHWLDATGYGRARDRESRKRKPAQIRRADYLRDYALTFDPLPAWEELDAQGRRRAARQVVDEITREASDQRQHLGRAALGAETVRAVDLERRTALPRPPWFEQRKRMICWANPVDPPVRSYLAEYWTFQAAYAEASKRFLGGELSVEFPLRAFRPRTYRGPPRPHAQ